MFRIAAAAALAASTFAVSAWAAQPPFDFIPEPAAAHPDPPPPDAKLKSVKLSRMAFELKAGEPWVQIDHARNIGRDSRFLTWTGSPERVSAAGFDQAFAEEVRSAAFASANTSLFDDAGDADLQIGAIVKDVRVRHCENCWFGEKTAAVFRAEWQIYDPLERKVLAKLTTSGGAATTEHIPGGLEKIIFTAYRDSVRRLIASPEFRNAVLGATAARGGEAAATLSPITFSGAPPSARPIASAARSVATIFSTGGHGSGFLVSSDGYMLTNQHVVGAGKYVKVRWPDGAEELGEVVRADSGRDVALVKVTASPRPPLAVRSTPVQPGETVFAIGTPLDAKYENTVTRGVLSATRVEQGRPYLQSDVTVNGGNSGGPLLDETGAVVGVTVMGFQPDGLPTGINLFIPIADALEKLALKPAA